MLLTPFESVATSDITVVTGKPDLFEIHGRTILVENEQSRLELESSLVNRHRMPDVSSCGARHDLVGCAVERNFELTNTVDTVKQAQEMNCHIWTAEGRLEFLHVRNELLVLFRGGIISFSLLVIAKGIPSELDHLVHSLG